MTSLTQQKCSACHKGTPRVTEAEISELKPQVPNWEIINVDGEARLERTYKFSNFQTALAFTNRVGEIAEAEGHHPALLTEWGQVKVSWWTHTIHGLHLNDFIMSAKTDEIAAQFTEKN